MNCSRRGFLKAGLSWSVVQALSFLQAQGLATLPTEEVDAVNLELVGAHFDARRRDLILIGRQNHLHPTPVYAEDLIVILRTVQHTQGEAIGVSIDRGPSRERMVVNYFPEDVEPFLRHTRAGDCLWKSDFLLKCYGLNRDPRTGQEMKSTVKAYRSELDFALEELMRSLSSNSSGKHASASGWHRLWFEPFMRVMHSADGLTMVLDNPIMVVRTERVDFDAQRRPIRNWENLKSPPAAHAFARQITRLFSAFAADELELRRLAELAKLVKFSRWVLDVGIPFDSRQLERFPVRYHETPRTVPTAEVWKSVDFGWMRYYAGLYGGVTLVKRNHYARRSALQVASTGASALPPPGFTTWRIEIDGYPYVAASVSAILGVR